MRTILFFLFYGILSSCLDSTILSGFPLGRIYSVDLFIVAVATIAFDDDLTYKISSLFILGALRDVSSCLPWGVSFLSYLVVLAVFKFLNRTISLHHGVAIGVWTFVISLLDKIIIAIVFLIASKNITANNILLYSFPQAIGDGLLAVIMIPLIIKGINFLLGGNIGHPQKIG